MKEWDFIVDRRPQRGAWNMAVDDFLFQSLSEKSQTYLRFYMWKRPTASLGYSQKVQKVLDVEFCKQNGIDVVRRMTGGKLVLHHREVTYSVCSSDVEIFSPTLAESYRLISEALIKGLEIMGLRPVLAEEPPASYTRGNLPCFSYPAQNEIEVDGKKIIGSAQKRTGFQFIQHGSIPLEEDDELLKSLSQLESEKNEVRMISLNQALGRSVDFEWVVGHLASGFSEYFGAILKSRVLNKKERKAISVIQKEKYENPQWTYGKRH